jgi:hypothetical protein
MSRWKDVRGVEITPGCKVAYNLGGDVVPGEVMGVTHGQCKIKCEATERYYFKPGHISRVKNPRSILVLRIAP